MTSHDTSRNISLAEMDKQSLLHPYTSIAEHLDHGPIVITEGHAARVPITTVGTTLMPWVDFGA